MRIVLALFSALMPTSRLRVGMPHNNASMTGDSVPERCHARGRSARAVPRLTPWRIFAWRGKAGRLGSVMTAVVVGGSKGKEYRPPTDYESAVAMPTDEQVQAAFEGVPFGVPDEPTPAGGGSGAGRAFSVQGYGLMKWRDLFARRQFMTLGTFIAATRAAREAMSAQNVEDDWIEAIGAYLAIAVDRLADSGSALTHFQPGGEFVVNTVSTIRPSDELGLLGS